MSLKKFPILLSAAFALVLALSACSSDCPACSSITGPGAEPVNTLEFDLCVSQVPEPTEDELGCGSVSVEFVLVGGS